VIQRKKTAKRPAKPAARKPAPRSRAGAGAAKFAKVKATAKSGAAQPNPSGAEPSAAQPAPTLTPKQLRELRGQAHSLEPIVQVGHSGITPAVVRAISRALLDHALIKVRLHEPEDKKAMAAELAESTRAALCGLVGHTVILYRPKKPKPTSGVARSAIKRNQGPKRGRH